MATGYEQARSVVAELAGDHAGARNVALVLPETGVCNAVPSLSEPAIGCCGRPAPAQADACCIADAEAKTAGKAGCGCGQPSKAEKEMEPARMTPRATWPSSGAGRYADRRLRHALLQLQHPRAGVAAELATSLQWAFGVLSVSAAGRLMVPDSSPQPSSLVVYALAPGRLGFAAACSHGGRVVLRVSSAAKRSAPCRRLRETGLRRRLEACRS